MNLAGKRRTYLVDRSFQLKYVALLAGWGVALAVLLGLWMWEAHEYAGRHGDRASDPSGAALLWVLPPVAVLSGVVLGLVGFRMSYRIAGPVHVIGRDLRLLAQGYFPHQRPLRRSDELKGLFELFRHAVNALRAREERRAIELEEVLAALRGAESRAPELARIAARLAAEVEDRRRALEEGAPGAPPPEA
jgi:methyl-accepting chemotaxis protein